MDFLPAVIVVLIVGLLLTFICDNNKNPKRTEDGFTTILSIVWDWLEAAATHAITFSGGQEDKCKSVMSWLGGKPGTRSRLSSGQCGFDTVDAGDQGQEGLLGHVATAQKWNLIFLVSPVGHLQAYDEPSARALESRVRAAYGDLDFQWAFASRLQLLQTADSAKGTEKTLDGFTDDGFAVQRLPQWDRMVPHKAMVVSYDSPKSISGLVVGDGSLARAEKVVQLKVAPLPFAKKGYESAFYALEIDSGVKGLPPAVQSLRSVATELRTCEMRAEQYAVTNYLLAIFTQKVRSAGLKAEQLTVPTMKVVNMLDQESSLHGILQPMELDTGIHVKFTTQSLNDKEREVALFLQSFMHWTHDRTNGELMLIVDKGIKVYDDGYWLVEPKIYTKDFIRFGSSEVGRDGMNAFLASHECNHFCEKIISNNTKRLNRNNRKDVCRMSIRESPKIWSARSAQSIKEIGNVGSVIGDWTSPHPLKPVKCDFAPIWKALKRNKKDFQH